MHFVGIDLHRKRSQVAVLDGEGRELRSRRIVNDPELFLALLAEIDGECRVALEATYGWEWLAELLEDAGYQLHLAHPLRTKAIASARVKTDAVDARTLAHLLRSDLLPEAYIAPRELRDVRDLLRHRVALTRMRSALKNRVGAILAKYGDRAPLQRPLRPGWPALSRRTRAARGAAPPARQPALADRRLHPRDRDHQPGDRPPRAPGPLRRCALPDPGDRPLPRPADHRRDQ
jgi:transposase